MPSDLRRPEHSPFTSVRSRTWTLVSVAAALGAFVLATAIVPWLVPELTDPAWIRARIEGYGPFAPVVFVLVQAAQVVLAPIPGQLLTFVGGYLFNTVYGAIYSLLGAALGSSIVFLFARRYGRAYVERVLTVETIAAFDGLVDRDGLFVLFLVFLLPGLPDDTICFLAGLTRLPLWQLIVVSVVGRVPGYVLVSYAGAQLASANYLETVGILALLALLSILAYWRKETILARFR